MPYKIIKLPNSNLYKVHSPGRSYSRKGLPYERARRQQIALIIAEKKKSGKYISSRKNKRSRVGKTTTPQSRKKSV
jgi:hypothetical protein